jgi:biopolymer transport protein ExbD
VGFKKKSKVSAEFNMSSLTDIIFLLLIFFMLTSSLVVPNALNLKLPGKSSKTKIYSKPTTVTIERNGTYFLDGKRISLNNLETAIRRLRDQKGNKNFSITISPDPKVAGQNVVAVMDIAYRYGITAVLMER